MNRIRILSLGTGLLAAIVSLGPAVQADTHTWTGGGSGSLASTAGNWGGTAPSTGDDIVLTATTNKAMTWDAAAPSSVASWTQVGYLGTVTIATVYGPTGFTNLTIAGDCTISNGVWTHLDNTTAEMCRLKASVGGNFTLGPNAAIDVGGVGYNAGYGPGTPGVLFNNHSGAAHGGRGAEFSGFPTVTYGSMVRPVAIGSGGATPGYTPPSKGAGAILLTVSGVFSNHGTVTASAYDGAYGRGSGGSVNIQAGALAGTGTFRANGGSASATRAGGGGRVALAVTNAGADFSAIILTNISAYGGLNSNYPTNQAGAGTLYLRTASQGANDGLLIVDNRGATGGVTTVSSLVTDASVGDVLIRRLANLTLGSNQSLTVSGVFSNGALFTAENNGKLVVGGIDGSTSTVFGSSTFSGLECTVPGKTLRFAAGSTNAVQALGQLTLNGSAASNIVLRSTVDGTSWKLTVSAAANQSISCVDVKDSNASSGTPVVALASADGGNNLNWVFSGGPEILTWNGASNTVWGQAANWDLARAPQAQDRVVIPSGMPRYPVLDAPRTVAGLTLQTAASLALNGYNLTVSGDAANAGAVTAAGTETFLLQGDVDFAGGSFTAARSTVVIGGTGAQAVNPAGLTFFKIRVTNQTAAVSFVDGFSAREFRCETASGLPDLVFQQGALYTIRDWVLLGSSASTNITLRSSSPGLSWNLCNVGYNYVRGADVRDSDASSGRTVNPMASLDSGHNPNWNFAGGWAVWRGTNSTSFHDARNWAPSLVPGSTTRVFNDATNLMSVTSAVTVLEVMLGGSQAARMQANAALTVGETIELLNGGTLTLNRPGTVGSNLLILAGGVLTHAANTTGEINKLTLTVGENAWVDSNGAIDVTGAGFAGTYGPGKGTGAQYGGSYGGVGGGNAGATYGAVIAPTNLGSGGGITSGGGAVLLTVNGGLTNEGSIVSDGSPNVGNYYTGSGGSINIRAGTVSGSGLVRASGGVAIIGGAGGRVAVALTQAGATFAGFAGTLAAYGNGSSGCGGAGTIYLQTADQAGGRGVVTLDNVNQAGARTMLPPMTNATPNELRHTMIVVTNRAAMQVSTNMTARALVKASTNEVLNLGSNTVLTLSSMTLNGTTYAKIGSYRTNSWNGFSTPFNVSGLGEIVIAGTAKGVVIVVR